MDVDVRDIDCDFYVFTGHKGVRPNGHRRAIRQIRTFTTMPPFNGGGEMIHEVFRGSHHLWRAAL